MSSNGLENIEHIVVLMFENRSFDNVLGWLYDSQNAPPFNQVPSGQSFEGLDPLPPANPWTYNGTDYSTAPRHGTDMSTPIYGSCSTPSAHWQSNFIERLA